MNLSYLAIIIIIINIAIFMGNAFWRYDDVRV